MCSQTLLQWVLRPQKESRTVPSFVNTIQPSPTKVTHLPPDIRIHIQTTHTTLTQEHNSVWIAKRVECQGTSSSWFLAVTSWSSRLLWIETTKHSLSVIRRTWTCCRDQSAAHSSFFLESLSSIITSSSATSSSDWVSMCVCLSVKKVLVRVWTFLCGWTSGLAVNCVPTKLTKDSRTAVLFRKLIFLPFLDFSYEFLHYYKVSAAK